MRDVGNHYSILYLISLSASNKQILLSYLAQDRKAVLGDEA